MKTATRPDAPIRPEGPTPAATADHPNDRGGRIDIQDRPGKSKVEEASEESFPASDAPALTPAGYIDGPPPSKRCGGDGGAGKPAQ